MAVRVRNLDFDSSAPLDLWPAEAVATLIDRGSISDWRRLATAIRQSPCGPAARVAEAVVARDEHYGLDRLISMVIDEARADLTLRGRVEYAERIRAWRLQAGLTLRQLATLAGTSASRLSAYENAKVAPTTDVLARLSHAASTRRVERGKLNAHP